MTDSRSTPTRHAEHGRYPQAGSVAELSENIALVRERIAAACARVGRDPSEVRLLPVSKTKSEEVLRLAYQAGCRYFGENKVLEAKKKAAALSDLPDLSWSVIGHLQSNKAKEVATFAHEFQALDSLRVAEKLDRRLQAAGRGLDVFVQVNTSAEESKYGLAPDQVADFLNRMPDYASLRVRGLMTLAMFSADVVLVRDCFVKLRTLRDRLRDSAPEGVELGELSMGMSGDFELAIEEGSTVVRVGQAIFGARPTPDGHYWPGAAP